MSESAQINQLIETTNEAEASDADEPSDHQRRLKLKKAPSRQRSSQLAIRWAHDADFVICAIGYVVGFGNITVFPQLCYRHGGASFIFLYVVCLFGFGIPVLTLEFAAGQLSTGVFNYWLFCPLFRGIEFACFGVNLYGSLVYIVSLSKTVLYLSYSIERDIPWEKCRQPWATSMCADYIKNVDWVNCTGNITWFENGTCNYNNGTLYGIFNETLAKAHGFQKALPAQDFMNHESFKIAESEGLHNIGPLRWRGSLCLATTVIMIFAAQIKGVRSTAKVSYFTSTFPVFVIFILTINAFMMEGSGNGLKHYLTMTPSKILDMRVLKAASAQVLYSLSFYTNGLETLASHNNFHHNFVRDAFSVALADFGISLLAGVALFACVGVFAQKMGVDVNDVLDDNGAVAYVVYPQALSMMPFPRVWTIIFFLMMFTVGFSVQLFILDTLILTIMKHLKLPIKVRLKISAAACLIMFLIGLTMTTPGGRYVKGLISGHGFRLDSVIAMFFVAVALAIYGPKRFCDDIQLMVGPKPLFFIPWKALQWYFIVGWIILAPLFAMIIVILSLYNRDFMENFANHVFPPLACTFGFTLAVIPLLFPILTIIWDMYKSKGNCCERFSTLLKPDKLYKCKKALSQTGSPILDDFSDVEKSDRGRRMSFSLASHGTYPQSDQTHSKSQTQESSVASFDHRPGLRMYEERERHPTQLEGLDDLDRILLDEANAKGQDFNTTSKSKRRKKRKHRSRSQARSSKKSTQSQESARGVKRGSQSSTSRFEKKFSKMDD